MGHVAQDGVTVLAERRRRQCFGECVGNHVGSRAVKETDHVVANELTDLVLRDVNVSRA